MTAKESVAMDGDVRLLRKGTWDFRAEGLGTNYYSPRALHFSFWDDRADA